MIICEISIYSIHERPMIKNSKNCSLVATESQKCFAFLLHQDVTYIYACICCNKHVLPLEVIISFRLDTVSC